MRGIEPQQTGEMRVDAQPLRSEDAQNMRMSHQQHIVADVQQRQYSFDGVPGTRGGLLHVLARTVMHRNLLAGRQCLNPIAFKSGVQRTRTIPPYVPGETAGLADLLACAPLGATVIPFGDLGQDPVIAVTGERRGLAGTAKRTCEHAAWIETVREGRTQTLSRGFGL